MFRPRLEPQKRPPWFKKLSPALRKRVDAEVEARAEYAAAIYRRWNLARFIGARSFRTYVRRRRALIREYEIEQRRKKSSTGTH